MSTGWAFWSGWMVGLALPTTALVLVAENVVGFEDDPAALALAQIAAGALVLGVALRIALASPREDAAAPPSWLAALDRAGWARAASLAVVLSALNPKNLALMVAAAVAIAHAGEQGSELALATFGFVLVAASTVSLLLACQVLLAERTQPPLARLRTAVARHDRAIAIVLGLVLGLFFVLDGLRAL